MPGEGPGIAGVADAPFGVDQGVLEVKADRIAFLAAETVSDVSGRQGDAFLIEGQEDVVQQGVEPVPVLGVCGARWRLPGGRASSGGLGRNNRARARQYSTASLLSI